MRTSRTIRRSLAVINVVLVAVVGISGVASAASTNPTPPSTANAAVNQAAPSSARLTFAPSAQPQERSFLVTAPAAECAALHVKAGCQNRVYVGVGPVERIAAVPTVVRGADTITPNLQMLQRTVWDEICSAISCSVWHMKETAVFDFNSAVVTSVSNNCYDYGGFGVSFQVNVCDSVNNGTTSQSPGGGTMYDEDFTLLSGIASGMPISKTYWIKIHCNVDGFVTYEQN